MWRWHLETKASEGGPRGGIWSCRGSAAQGRRSRVLCRDRPGVRRDSRWSVGAGCSCSFERGGGFFVRGRVRGHSHSQFSSSISILHVCTSAREMAHPVAGQRGRRAGATEAKQAGSGAQGGQERIKDGAQWFCAAVLPVVPGNCWGCGCWAMGAGGDGIAVSEVVYCTTMDRKKERGTETLGDRQQSPRQVPPVGIFGKGRGVEGGGSQNWCQAAQPNPSPVQSSPVFREQQEQQQRTHVRTLARSQQACTRNRHNPLVLCQCHVARVVSIGREDENRTVRIARGTHS